MDQYILQLRDYFAAHPPDFGDGNAESILDMLHWHYAEHNPIYNQTIKEGCRQLDAYLSRFSIDDNNAALNIVCDLCSEHERLAFIAGLQVGFRLQGELQSEMCIK